MGQSKEYKSLQIPKDDFEILKSYCTYHSILMGKFVGKLIRSNCPAPPKQGGNIMKVEKRNGN